MSKVVGDDDDINIRYDTDDNDFDCVDEDMNEMDDLDSITFSALHSEANAKNEPQTRFALIASSVKHKIVSYKHMMTDVLGVRFVVFLLFSQLLGKGMLSRIGRGVLLPLFKSLSVDAATLQVYTVAIMIPWATKPLMGLASDLVLLGGYHKRYWLVMAGIFGTVSLSMCVPAFYVLKSPVALLFCFFGANVQLAFYDLLSEGKYSEIRNENPHIGSDATTLVQGMNVTGALIAMSFVGIVADAGLYWVLFLIAALLAASALPPTLAGWLPEFRLVNASCVQLVSQEHIRSQRKMIMVVLFCGIGSAAVSLLASLVTPVGGLVAAVVLLVASLAGCYVAFPEAIFQVALYQVLRTLARPSVGGALSYFYTADEACLPNGPGFSYSYYITYTGLVGTSISFAGVWLYQLTLSRMRFRPVLLLTTVLAVFGGLADLIITMRWNVMWGVSDKTAYMLGEAILEPLLEMMNWIPASALIAMAVPKGMESSCFAFMAGISNFSAMVSQISGSVLYKSVGVQTTVPCNFEALPWLVLMCNVCLPLMIAVPAVWLVPNLKQTDRL